MYKLLYKWAFICYYITGKIQEWKEGNLMAKTVVRNNESLEDALKRFKRDISRSGTLAEARKREYYVKPSVSKKIKQRQNKNKK